MWKILYVDEGYCRIVYESEQGGRVCFQDEGAFVQCLTLTDEDEPWTVIPLKESAYELFEVPTGDSVLQTKVREFLQRGAA